MRRSLNRNHYFILGFLLGLLLSFYVPEDIWELVQNECPQAAQENFIDKFGEDFEPHLNLINKPLAAKKPIKNLIRPRYYSSELGIREKLFIGVMTSQENINTLATAFNRTAAHLVNRIKFFINADNVKTTFQLRNIVGFTDTRENLKPFHILKYIADNYLDDYDYFLLTFDTNYVNVRKLKEILYHISITFDIYMGYKLGSNKNHDDSNDINNIMLMDKRKNSLRFDSNNNNDLNNFNDINNRERNNYKIDDDDDNDGERNYCDLNAGILLSSSVIRKIRTNLDWCVRNAVTNQHSINIGKCVKYSSKVTGCQEAFQGMKIKSFNVDERKLYKDLKYLDKSLSFRNSSIIYPITNTDDFYTLHAYFSKLHLEKLRNDSQRLEQKAYHIANGTISNHILEIRWPLGVSPYSVPDTRHDILPWQFINETHQFMPNYEDVLKPFTKIDKEEFQKILQLTLSYAKSKYPEYEYEKIHTAYRRYDPIRGMDYYIHLRLMKKDNSRSLQISKVVKSFHVVKPLGRVEIVPSPYVTESTKVAIVIPVFEHQILEGGQFISHYEKTCMENQDNTFLMIIFIYRQNSPSKGDSDPFKDLKKIALDLSKKFKNDGSRVSWLSIRLPSVFSKFIRNEDTIMLSSTYAQNEILSLAVIDLSLRKIGLESLVMLGSNPMTFKADFLNRVRMNTIQGFQVYSPIGFMMYPCNFAHFCKECDSCDVSQGTGYFDKLNYDVISFYSRDYVEARKKLESIVPIVRNDNDIENLLNRSDQDVNNVVDIFLRAELPIHVLRGIEPNLRFGNAARNYFNNRKLSDIPKCPVYVDAINDQSSNNNVNIKNDKDSNNNLFKNEKCIHLASRKQVGDAIVKFEDQNSFKRN